MSPNFTSTLFAIFNTVGIAGGFYVPYIVGAILESGDSIVLQWNLVFYISSATMAIACIIYVIFVKSQPEPWDEIEQDLKAITSTSCNNLHADCVDYGSVN